MLQSLEIVDHLRVEVYVSLGSQHKIGMAVVGKVMGGNAAPQLSCQPLHIDGIRKGILSA